MTETIEAMPKDWIEACRNRDECQLAESPDRIVPSTHERLADLETTVERGLRELTDAGRALQKIRDDKLYREAGYASFARYVNVRFGLSKSHAYRLIKEAVLVAEMSPTGDTFICERQARELARLSENDRPKVVQWVIEQGGFTKVGSPQIAERVDWILAERSHERMERSRKPTTAT